MDIKWEKVFNWWVLTGWVTSFLIRFYYMDNMDWMLFFSGTVGTFLILFPLFLFKMLGTGDIKVFMVLGSITGIRKNVECIVISFIIAAVISLPVLIFRCDIRERFKYFFSYVEESLKNKTILPYLAPGKRPENIHFTIAVTCSVIYMIINEVV